MAVYVFETMSAADAAAYTSSDTLSFQSTAVSSLSVTDTAGTALTNESITISSGSHSLVFSAAQLSAATEMDHVSFNNGDYLLLGTNDPAVGDNLNLSTGHSTTELAGAEVYGFGGDDTITGSNANDTILGGAGSDVIIGHSDIGTSGDFDQNDFLMGGAADDTITGGDGNDHIYGNAITTVAGAADGADSLDGGNNNDYIQGNAGNDTIIGGEGNDRLYGGADADSITGGNGIDYLQGNKGADFLDGGNGNDQIHGGQDDDTLTGGNGNDTLFGDNGDDTVTGGNGFDALNGGGGNDVFLFGQTDALITDLHTASTVMDHGLVDTIVDFGDTQDTITLDYTPGHVVHGVAGATFTDPGAAQDYAQTLLTTQGDVVAVTVGADTYLFFNGDDSSTTIDSAIHVLGHTDATFTLADFG